jgi:ADP-ribose pyrophosphatase
MKKADPGFLQPIPEHAKLVFHGVLFDVYQWEQKMFDGSMQTFEKLTRHDTANAIVATADGKIVMTKQEQPGMRPVMGLPGGKVDTGEEPLATAKRELLEETGYEATDWSLWLTLHPFEKINYTSYSYVARDARQVREPAKDEGEKTQLQFLTFDQFMALMLNESYRDDEVALGMLRLKYDPAKLAELKRSLGLQS